MNMDIHTQSARHRDRQPRPPTAAQSTPGTGLADALAAPRHALDGTLGGRLAYYSDTSGTGRPLVLVHSINAAPSSYEVKPLFEHYRGRRPVYSLDLPGFGQSERRRGPYSPELFGRVLADFLEQVVRAPADILALSLSAEFAARAAHLAPLQIASLVLVSPTGFSARALPAPWIGRTLHHVLSSPLLAQWLYDLVASRRSIRHYLGQSFLGAPPVGMLDYAYATSHQPGARHAPLVFLSTLLFTRRTLETLYQGLTDRPVLVIADQDPYVDFERLPEFVATRPNWHWQRLAPHRGLPHWERLADTVAVLDQFWSQAT